MAVGFSNTNKPLNPRGNDASPKGYNRAALYSGKALSFDGVNDYVDAGNDLDIFNSAFTITAHVWVDADTAENSIFEILDNGSFPNHNTIVFSAGNNNPQDYRLLIRNYKSNELDIRGTGTIEKNKWHYFTATFDGTNAKVYLNAIEQASGTFGDWTNPIGSIDHNYVGLSASNRYLNGQLSGFKIFNTALTAAQVVDLYNNPEKVVPTGVDNTALKLWLPMMEGAGTTAYDGSGNGNHGTISGATYVNGVGSPVAQSAVMDWNKGTNKAQYSEQFDNAYYNVNNTSKSANETTAPDGQTTADKITATLTNDHYIWNTSIALSGQNTISVFAKYNGYNIGLRPQGIGSGQAFANFDLQNGTILGSGGTSYNDSSITSFGNGWYRCSLTLTYPTPYGFGIYVVNGTTATELPSFTADGTSGYYLWGAQVNAGATLTPYVRTGATAQTSDVLLPQGLTSGRDITGVNLFENVRKQGALNLDGNSWAEVHDNESLDISPAMTMECWVDFSKIDSATLRHFIVKPSGAVWNTPYARYALRASNTEVQWWFESAGYLENHLVSLTGWNHFAVTKNGTAENLYINGTQVDSNVGNATITASAENLLLGQATTGLETLDSQIAQPRIYNRALTAAEVLQNYNSGKNTYK